MAIFILDLTYTGCFKMKNSVIYIIVVFAAISFSCETNTYEDIGGTTNIVGDVTYEGHIKAVIDNNCIVCHSPGGESSFRPFTSYEQVREAVLTTNLLDRIQRQNGEEGQMPKTGRMPQDKINLILEWNNDGLQEN